MEPGLQHLMSESRDYDELLWAWKGWHDAVGPKIGKLYPTYVSLLNEAAINGGRYMQARIQGEGRRTRPCQKREFSHELGGGD